MKVNELLKVIHSRNILKISIDDIEENDVNNFINKTKENDDNKNHIELAKILKKEILQIKKKREKKVEELKSKIKQGKYNIPPEEIANSIVDNIISQ